MAEFDTIELYNPTDEDFLWKFNGEQYILPASSSKAFAQFVGYHLAKHLSTKIIEREATEELKKKKEMTPQQRGTAIAQRVVYDSHWRRIALYQILKDTELVEKCISLYPFKGFVGNMELYKEFVTKSSEK